MRILTMTTLYPNAAAPAHGVFVENRLKAFTARRGGELRVVAPVPWFPIRAKWAGKYGRYARAPHNEIRCGVPVDHPRYAIPPKIGMTYAAYALERCFHREATRLLEAGWDFDVIDAHYLYPDAVAAAATARRLGKPVVVTARGADVNFFPRYPRQRRMILDAVRRADAVIAVAGALKDELVALGAPAEKIEVLRNGVDLEMFRPLDRAAIRARLGLSGEIIASVGHLIERKGHHCVIEALASLPGAQLLIVGEGAERARLAALARRLGVADCVRFLGQVAHQALAEIYNAADVLVLASSREGWPNVLLEAMACGTPAVATPVWGSPEVITAPAAGRLAAARSPEAIAQAIAETLAERPSRKATRDYAERYSWNETSDGLQRIFSGVVERAKAAAVTTRPIGSSRARRRPHMILTVDTEEIFDWSRFDGPDFTIAPPSDIDRFQALAASHGAAPLYFLSYPLLKHEASSAYFDKLRHDGHGDLGLHLHQWSTPPFAGFVGAYNSFERNLPTDVYRSKLAAAAAAFETAFGFRARAYRAGRYGVSPACYEALAAIGVEYDFSPSPAFDFSAEGGPDYSAMSNQPFAIELANGRTIEVTPVCGARLLRGIKRPLTQPVRRAGFQDAAENAPRLPSWPMRLSCEGNSLVNLKRLTRSLAAEEKIPVLTFSLHSTTLTPGASPYARNAEDVDRLLALCDDYFRFFRNELGGEFARLDDLGALYRR